MPDLFDLIIKRWKLLFLAVLLPVLVVGIIIFRKPRLYLAVSTAIPSSSFANDKSAIFNENIQQLYTSFGSSDDVDRIVGTANLDTIYLSISDQLKLSDHYEPGGKNQRTEAALRLKENVSVMKSAHGELKVKAWDKDKDWAVRLSDAVMIKLESFHRDLSASGNQSTLEALMSMRNKLQVQVDSSLESPDRNVEFRERIKQYDKMIGEYQLMIDSKPPSLIIVEPARAKLKPDRPKRLQVMITTLVLSFLFSLLLALIAERSKKNPE